jgi:hypothetical protein
MEVAARTAKAPGTEQSAGPTRDEYIDPKGYWIDSNRNIRRLGNDDGEQIVVVRATESCSDAEWDRFYEAIVACLDTKV